MQQAPDDAEIKKRVTAFFPRASAMIFAADFDPVTSANDSESVSSHNFSADSSFKSRQKYNANYQWAKSSSKNTTSKDNSGKNDSCKDNSGNGFREMRVNGKNKLSTSETIECPNLNPTVPMHVAAETEDLFYNPNRQKRVGHIIY
jgi:hypothetical protein